MRIDKFLSECRVATRRESAAAIRRGAVSLDGEVVRRADTQVDPERCQVVFCGEPVVYRRFTYVLLNKPEGFVCATEDTRERTVMELLPPEVRKFDLFPCGRLDKYTLGLVLLTDNGPLAHRLLSPRRHVEKEYVFTCANPVTPEDLEALCAGVDIGGYRTKPCRIWMSGADTGCIILSEGKYHQIRRMFEARGNRIFYLERVRFAALTLDGLPRGEWRYLTKEEISALEAHGE